jgi:hypothetical protein
VQKIGFDSHLRMLVAEALFQLTALAALASVVALASPASADVKVNIAGKDPATIASLVRAAAVVACRQELAGSMVAIQMQPSCVKAATADAMAQVAAKTATYASTPTSLELTRISASK